MAEQGYISTADAQKWMNEGLGLEAGHRYETIHEPLLLRLRRAGADRALRRPAGARGRPQGLHDDQPAAAELRRAGGRRLCGLRRRSLDRAGVDRLGHRPHPRDGLLEHLRRVAEQPRRQRAPPAGLLVQAVRADDGAQGGHRPGLHLLRRQQSEDPVPLRSVRRGVAGQQRRGRGGRLDEPRLRHDPLGQCRLRAARHRRRPRERRRDSALDWGSRARSTDSRPRASAVCGSASHRSRWPTPTRPSPTAAPTTTRPRSRRSSFPPTTAATTARSTTSRTRRATG